MPAGILVRISYYGIVVLAGGLPLYAFIFLSERELISLNIEVKQSMKVAYAEETFMNQSPMEKLFNILLLLQVTAFSR